MDHKHMSECQIQVYKWDTRSERTWLQNCLTASAELDTTPSTITLLPEDIGKDETMSMI